MALDDFVSLAMTVMKITIYMSTPIPLSDIVCQVLGLVKSDRPKS